MRFYSVQGHGPKSCPPDQRNCGHAIYGQYRQRGRPYTAWLQFRHRAVYGHYRRSEKSLGAHHQASLGKLGGTAKAEKLLKKGLKKKKEKEFLFDILRHYRSILTAFQILWRK